jgi:hypothetical protein
VGTLDGATGSQTDGGVQAETGAAGHEVERVGEHTVGSTTLNSQLLSSYDSDSQISHDPGTH